MPRDLFPPSPSPPLSHSPEPQSSPQPERSESQQGPTPSRFSNVLNSFMIYHDHSDDREMQLSNSLRTGTEKANLHPYVQALSIADLESCLALEEACFPEAERGSREKVCQYSLCSEVAMSTWAVERGSGDVSCAQNKSLGTSYSFVIEHCISQAPFEHDLCMTLLWNSTPVNLALLQPRNPLTHSTLIASFPPPSPTTTPLHLHRQS